jgi:hypothetical protein
MRFSANLLSRAVSTYEETTPFAGTVFPKLVQADAMLYEGAGSGDHQPAAAGVSEAL